MASTSAIAMTVLPSPASSTTRRLLPAAATTARLPRANRRFEVRASSSVKEQAVAGLTAAAMAAAFLVPEVAEAAQPGMSASLKNFLLSIVSGGVVLGAILGAVIGVSNFDPVKRT